MAGGVGDVPSSIVTEDLTGTCWRDDMWLGAFGLHHGNVLDYFALSPFYDRACNNERAFLAGKPRAAPPAMGEGVEYLLADSQPPHLFILRKLYRQSLGAITTLAFYYILDGAVYQAPSLQAALLARMQRCMYCIRGAFADMQQDLAPLGAGAEAAAAAAQASALERELKAGRDVPRALTPADREQQQRVEANVRHVLRQFPLPVPTALLEAGSEPAAAAAAAAADGGGGAQVKAEPQASLAAAAGGAPPLPSAMASHGGGGM
ncbi:mediator of RNA polymerase II transcription subunit 6 [Micractinium conductrix]|uniref:Mediator of RNA polymerase II transcription subunit 6 n=1 Tax=Micractinium conductrix TaxID=554055 RepID=A0A2P6V4A5_9CHLO|nr:mediator of RNA polymerase II transcription subunit 6 [Micractinium conductrix]|eukprot:PSC68914.1 mediator of RNA polymerase II transcription subunit 6 [Micractinium conductrix]